MSLGERGAMEGLVNNTTLALSETSPQMPLKKGIIMPIFFLENYFQQSDDRLVLLACSTGLTPVVNRSC